MSTVFERRHAGMETLERYRERLEGEFRERVCQPGPRDSALLEELKRKLEAVAQQLDEARGK